MVSGPVRPSGAIRFRAVHPGGYILGYSHHDTGEATHSNMAHVIPSHRQLAAGSDAAFRNAQRLAVDARVLLGLDRWPLAHAVAVLALEELGKHIAYLTAALSGDGLTQERWEELRRRMRSHDDKIATASGLRAVALKDTPQDVLADIASLEELAKRDSSRKLLGFYVDLSADGLLEPTSIGEEEASEMVEGVSRTIDFAERMPLPGRLIDRWDEVMAQGPRLRGEAAALMAKSKDDALAESIKQYRAMKSSYYGDPQEE